MPRKETKGKQDVWQTQLKKTNSHQKKQENEINNALAVIGNHPDKDLVRILLTDSVKKQPQSVADPLVCEIKKEIPYEIKQQMVRLGDKNGQEKLFWGEVEFLTEFCKKIEGKKSYVVYAGASPNNKALMLSEMFPDLIFILVDPREFEIYLGRNRTNRTEKHPRIILLTPNKKENVTDFCAVNDENYAEAIVDERNAQRKLFLVESLMDEKMAANFRGLPGHVAFISDIRSNSNPNSGKPTDCEPLDADILVDNTLSFVLMNAMNPLCSMLKVRTMFNFIQSDVIQDENSADLFQRALEINSGADFLAAYRNRQQLLPSGKFHVQTRQGKSSTEMRLIVERSEMSCVQIINNDDFESKLNYHNIFGRTFVYYDNPNADKSLGFGFCYDCCRVNGILTEYSNFFHPGRNSEEVKTFVREKINWFGRRLQRPLRNYHNNCFFTVELSERLGRLFEPNNNRLLQITNSRGKGRGKGRG